MAIDFHSEYNRNSYSARTADQSWSELISNLVPIELVSNALDVGCGGGIYSKALSDMGIKSVTSVDYSETILEGAIENCKHYQNITFQNRNALNTGLPNNCFDLVLERALIHHLTDLNRCVSEAYRVLSEGGFYIVQDRTPDDCFLEGSDYHIRGYLFELYPKLRELESKRRYKSNTVIKSLKDAGFKQIEEIKLWETRKTYPTKNQLLLDLRERTGRSILHELNDKELMVFLDWVNTITKERNIVEKDRWTIWRAIK
ncbi:class I SAM-dependent methyltransferase [Halalkalibacter okhensis]|uniref:Methyltransferase type 11 n=1 Tax=Halalkalibacter okhensis TaxID=333138 RepID=A0A0B0IJV7_9BACI|nr:class I SAM-dependent methyltransferase [Halalkalibacter okhensis]KHF39931.1 methyltransferase type 11 [Halalkalibacter okhensis]